MLLPICRPYYKELTSETAYICCRSLSLLSKISKVSVSVLNAAARRIGGPPRFAYIIIILRLGHFPLGFCAPKHPVGNFTLICNCYWDCIAVVCRNNAIAVVYKYDASPIELLGGVFFVVILCTCLTSSTCPWPRPVSGLRAHQTLRSLTMTWGFGSASSHFY